MKNLYIISPSGVMDGSLIDAAATRIEQWGYRVSLAPYSKERCGRFAGTQEERLHDINSALNDPQADIVLCSRGGYGLQQIADRICIPEQQVPLVVGFSDITVLHSLLGIHHHPSLHASMCKYIACLPEESAELHLLRKALHGEKMAYSVASHPNQRTGECQGTLIGGNLSVLYGLQGTPYSLHHVIDQCAEPPILLVEDVCERHYHIDRMMQNLRMSGVLERLGGLVVGQFTDCDDDPQMGCTVAETIMQAVEAYHYPVAMNFPVGHVEQNVPLRLNTTWHLSVTPDEVRLIEE